MTAYTDFHYSPTGSGVISGAQVLEQTEQGINGLGQYVQDNVSGAIDTANQALTIAQTADTNATLALNTANSFASAISAANNTANNALTTAQSAQNTANTASSLATTANNNANTALNAANTATSNVATLTSSVNALGNRMTTAENAISTNAGNITTLQTNLQTTNNNVTAAANAASAAQATATSAQGTATLARNQAYVLRYTGTTITGGGTIAYADIDNTDNIKAGDKIIDISGAIYAIASVDTANQTVTVGASPVINLFCDAENLIPAATDTYDLGSSSYQWNNLYAKNYYYNGTAWGLDKYNTWTNRNLYENYSLTIRDNNIQDTTPPDSDTGKGIIEVWNKDNHYWGGFGYKWLANGNSELVITLSNWNGNAQGYWEYKIGVNKAFNDLYFAPPHNLVNLGTSTNKWKTLNGINPGALSLPSGGTTANTDWFNVAGDILPTGGNATSFSKATANYFIPAKDGWLALAVKNCSELSVWCVTLKYGISIVAPDASANRQTVIPVVAGKSYQILITGNSWISARLIMPRGNV